MNLLELAKSAYPTRELSPREREALQLAADGFECKDSGIRMGVSTQYVKKLRHDAFMKLGADNTAHAVAVAMRRKLID